MQQLIISKSLHHKCILCAGQFSNVTDYRAEYSAKLDLFLNLVYCEAADRLGRHTEVKMLSRCC